MTRKEINLFSGETKGICKECSCTWNNACFNSEHGACWWMDETETLCSHCYYGWNEEGLLDV